MFTNPPVVTRVRITVPSPVEMQYGPKSSVGFYPAITRVTRVSPVYSVVITVTVNTVVEVTMELGFNEVGNKDPAATTRRAPRGFGVASPSKFMGPDPYEADTGACRVAAPEEVKVVLGVPFPRVLGVVVATDTAVTVDRFISTLLATSNTELDPVRVVVKPIAANKEGHVAHFAPARQVVDTEVECGGPTAAVPPRTCYDFSLSTVLTGVPMSDTTALRGPPEGTGRSPEGTKALGLMRE